MSNLSDDFWLWFIVVFMVIFWSTEAYLYLFAKKPTLSQKVIQWTKERPLLPFFVGVFVGAVAGHWWW